MSTSNPEIGRSILVNGANVNYHDYGQGAPLFLIHGSGPGVSAWANWRLVLPKFGETRRAIAPDMFGFGFTDRPQGMTYNLDVWVDQVIALMDALKIEKTDLVGNSFGGAIALAVAIRHPDRVRRLILMGSVGVHFPLTKGLDAAWGYTPSIENMRALLDVFAFDRTLVNDELAKLRYEASIRPGFQESFSSMFPAPRQNGVEALSSKEADIKALEHETLLIHGRDDQVIPMDTSMTLLNWISRSQLHVFGRCGHWVQIEHTERFYRLVETFVSEA